MIFVSILVGEMDIAYVVVVTSALPLPSRRRIPEVFRRFFRLREISLRPGKQAAPHTRVPRLQQVLMQSNAESPARLGWFGCMEG